MDETERSKIYIQMPVRIVVNSTNIFDYNYIIRKTLQNIKKRSKKENLYITALLCYLIGSLLYNSFGKMISYTI